MNLLGISGSLRRGSYNTALLRAAGADLPTGVAFRIWHGVDQIPAYDEDVATVPLPVVVFKRALAHADAVLLATPEYNASIPGALKNALDWASRPLETNPLREKPVAVIGASQGIFGAIWAQAELRKILRTLGAQVDDREVVVAQAQRAFTASGALCDPELARALEQIVGGLLETMWRRAA